MTTQADRDEELREARALIDQHGQRAHQVVVDQIVAAIRRGDDDEAVSRGAVLRAIEEIARGTARRQA